MVFVMKIGVMVTSRFFNDGTPCAVKVACTVWVRGKDGDYIKVLPIDIFDSPDSSAASCCVWRAD
jgi:hypothetical protein